MAGGWTTDANGKTVWDPNKPDAAPTKPGDTTAQQGIDPSSGDVRWFTIGPNGQPIWGALVPPSAANTPPRSTADEIAIATAPRTSISSSSSTSTSFNATPQWVKGGGFQTLYSPSGQVLTQVPDTVDASTLATLQNSYNIAALNETGANQRNTASIAGSAANTQAQIAGTRENTQAQIAGTAADRASQNAYGAWQQQNQQGFTSHENALSAAQRAGEFAANYGLQVAQQQTADRNAQIAAAKTFSDLSGAADLTGYDRFLAAGGGDAGNAIMNNGSSLTAKGQLGAGRALEASRAPLPTYGAAPGVPTVAPWSPTPWGSGPNGAVDLTANPNAPWQTAPGTSYKPTYPGQSAPAPVTLQQPAAGGVSIPMATSNTGNGGWQPTPGFAYGTGQPPIVRHPVTAIPLGASMDAVTDRYALGTGRNVLGYRPPTPPQDDPNAGIPSGFAQGTQDRYATGSFMTGDSTDPLDPAAGGAHPEQVTLQDPPGPNNARATIDPLVPPGVGPTGDMGMDEPDADDPTEKLGALLVALGQFLSAASESKEPAMAGPRMALGAMGRPRYALGTDATSLDGTGASALDQSAVNEVLGMRQQTPYSVNPFSSTYNYQDPTQRAINAAAFQTATGAPKEELDYVSNRYQPGGLGRGSTVNRELSLGV